MITLSVDVRNPKKDPFPLEKRDGYRLSVIARPGDADPRTHSPDPQVPTVGIESKSGTAAKRFYEDTAKDEDILVYNGLYNGITSEYLGYQAGVLTVFTNQDAPNQ